MSLNVAGAAGSGGVAEALEKKMPGDSFAVQLVGGSAGLRAQSRVWEKPSRAQLRMEPG